MRCNPVKLLVLLHKILLEALNLAMDTHIHNDGMLSRKVEWPCGLLLLLDSRRTYVEELPLNFFHFIIKWNWVKDKLFSCYYIVFLCILIKFHLFITLEFIVWVVKALVRIVIRDYQRIITFVNYCEVSSIVILHRIFRHYTWEWLLFLLLSETLIVLVPVLCINKVLECTAGVFMNVHIVCVEWHNLRCPCNDSSEMLKVLWNNPVLLHCNIHFM